MRVGVRAAGLCVAVVGGGKSRFAGGCKACHVCHIFNAMRTEPKLALQAPEGHMLRGGTRHSAQSLALTVRTCVLLLSKRVHQHGLVLRVQRRQQRHAVEEDLDLALLILGAALNKVPAHSHTHHAHTHTGYARRPYVSRRVPESVQCVGEGVRGRL